MENWTRRVVCRAGRSRDRGLVGNWSITQLGLVNWSRLWVWPTFDGNFCGFAGYGGLSVSVEGPSKADIQCGDNPDGTLKVGYKPTEPGNYTLNVRKKIQK